MSEDSMTVYSQKMFFKNSDTYTLQDLLREHAYTFAAHYENTERLIDGLALPLPQANKVAIIGINGPTCAGKTSFSKQLSETLSKQHPTVELSFEWFLYDRGTRAQLISAVARGKVPISEITRNAWDVKKYIDVLKELKYSDPTRQPSHIHLRDLYNRETGSQDDTMDLAIPYGGYVVVEGVSVLDIDHTDLVDLSIRLDVDNDSILVDRIITREQSKPPEARLSAEFLRERYEKMDLHHMRYLRKISQNRNTYIINTTDFNHIKVYSNAALS